MAAEPTYDVISADVIETTLSKYSPTVYDNVTKHNALLHNLRERNHIHTTDGGKSIIEQISFSNNHTAKFMSMRDAIPMDVVNVFTHSEWYYRFAQITIGIWLDEELQNAGQAAQYDIMATRTKNGVAEFNNLFAGAMYSEGNIDWKIDGIPFLIADDPTTGTVGGINRELVGTKHTNADGTVYYDPDNRFWRNQTLSLTKQFGIVGNVRPTPAQVEEGMNILWQKCEVFKDHPTSIYASNDMYNLYRQWLIDKRQDVSKSKVGDLEFTSLEFMGVPVYRDPFCPIHHMYFLNEEYIWLKAHKKMNFKFQPMRQPYDKYMHVIPLTFYGNFTMANAEKQGVLFYAYTEPLNEEIV